MANETPNKSTIERGQSQQERPIPELGVHYADVDERSSKDLLLWTKQFSSLVRFYRSPDNIHDGDWTSFFAESSIGTLFETTDDKVTPHLGLLRAFLKLYHFPQDVINRLPRRHLDFYFRRVLRLEKKTTIADRAHVLVEPKKNATPIEVQPTDLMSAGKDQTKVEVLYAPVQSTIVGHGEVVSRMSYFRDDRGRGAIRGAPIANSPNGVGGEFPKGDVKWRGFGHEETPLAEIGFGVSSAVLRLANGRRSAIVELKFASLPGSVTTSSLTGSFDVYVTGEKGWLGPFAPSAQIESGGRIVFTVAISADEPAIVDYESSIHGFAYPVSTPVLKTFLRTDGNLGYHDLASLTVNTVQVRAEVSGVTALQLENDNGVLDSQKAFLPFGSQPTKGSRFYIGYDEALSKRLSEIQLDIQWKDVPNTNLGTHYDKYEVTVTNSIFRATVSFQDGGSWNEFETGHQLFDASDATASANISLTHGADTTSSQMSQLRQMTILGAAHRKWATRAAQEFYLTGPVSAPSATDTGKRPGVITMTLERDFLHATYRKKYVENVLKFSKGEITAPNIPNEPYTPTIQELTLSYHANSTEVSVSSPTLNDYSNDDVAFFHLTGFGAMREHAYQRAQFEFLTSTDVSLLPPFPHRGELLIGLQGLKGGDSVSLLFQVAEGSADPELSPEQIRWFVLSDNYWRKLAPSEVILDTTDNLLKSGIVRLVIPHEATDNNTILPANQIWVKAAIADRVSAVSQLIEVAANAVEVVFDDHDNDPRRPAAPAGTIAKFKSPKAEVKKLKQPYAAFGGRPEESDDAYFIRVAERLRHKDRCLTAWDYERIVLAAFPDIHRIKCIPHSNGTSWQSPGDVLLVVIPDTRNKNAINPLQPKVPAHRIQSIERYVQARTVAQARIHVANPTYQSVEFQFKAKMHDGFEFNFYRQRLNDELIRILSPWADDSGKEITFGENIHKSIVLDQVEELEYIDFVTEFKMFSYFGDTNNGADSDLARPMTSDAILVSAPQHTITPYE